MSSAALLFLARMLLLVLLYLFLFLVVQALRQDLRVAARRSAQADAPASPAPAVPASAAAIPHLDLELLDAGQTALPAGQRFPLRDPLVIGRAPRSDITLEDDWVSARHVRLRHWNGDWLAEDLGSTNGTRVNGRPLTGAVPVRPGDVLDLGRVKFRLVEQP